MCGTVLHYRSPCLLAAARTQIIGQQVGSIQHTCVHSCARTDPVSTQKSPSPRYPPPPPPPRFLTPSYNNHSPPWRNHPNVKSVGQKSRVHSPCLERSPSGRTRRLSSVSPLCIEHTPRPSGIRRRVSGLSPLSLECARRTSVRRSCDAVTNTSSVTHTPRTARSRNLSTDPSSGPSLPTTQYNHGFNSISRPFVKDLEALAKWRNEF